MKGNVVVGLRKIYIALARFIWRQLSFTVGDSLPAFWVKLGANDLNCVAVKHYSRMCAAYLVCVNMLVWMLSEPRSLDDCAYARRRLMTESRRKLMKLCYMRRMTQSPVRKSCTPTCILSRHLASKSVAVIRSLTTTPNDLSSSSCALCTAWSGPSVLALHYIVLCTWRMKGV